MKQRSFQGFTLIELLVVSVILTLLSVVIAQILFMTLRTGSKTDALQTVKSNGDHAIDVMTRLIQNAQSVSIPESASCADGAVGEAFDTLSLTNADGGETTLMCATDAEQGISRIASASSSRIVYLTGDSVSVFDTIGSANSCMNNALSFACSSVGSAVSYVTVSYTLHQANSRSTQTGASSVSFQTTVTLRNK